MRRVPDLLINVDELKIILVLESPFKDELIHGHPLAGRTGIVIFDYINNLLDPNPLSLGGDSSRPLGCAIQNLDYQNLDYQKIGIMNASLCPLDKKCYPCGQNNEFVDALNFIRKNPNSENRRNLFHFNVENDLIRDFCDRVSRVYVQNEDIIYIPCGDLADKFLRRSCIPDCKILEKSPHPSPRNSNRGWCVDRDRDRDRVLRELID